MHIISDKMTQSVGKIRAITGLRDNIPGNFINVTKPHSGLNGFLCRQLSSEHGFISFPVLLIRFPEEKGSGHIRAEAIFFAAHIKQHTISPFQDSPVRLVMPASCIFTEPHQRRKGIVIRSQFPVDTKHLLCQLQLRHSNLNQSPEALHSLVIDCRCFLHLLLFIAVLTGPYLLHNLRGIRITGSRLPVH